MSGNDAPTVRGGDILTTALATTAAMAAVSYFSHLPGMHWPRAFTLILLLCCLLGGGLALGRWGGTQWWRGPAMGLLTGLLNLLILGSLLVDPKTQQLRPTVMAWLPGFLVTAAVVATIGHQLGARLGHRAGRPPAWLTTFALVLLGTTALLVLAGGLVTGFGAGMAVEDWPRTKSVNMFVFPLSRMTGGIYYEHTHRLLGALVGLSAVLFGLYAVLVRAPQPVKWAALGVVALVAVQGILGGLRVVQDDVTKGVIHGVLGQLILAAMAGLAVATTRLGTGPLPPPEPDLDDEGETPAERRPPGFAVPLLFTTLLCAQLVLGALLRHYDTGLIPHIIGAVLVILVGFIASMWLYEQGDEFGRSAGLSLGVCLIAQATLGFIALLTREPASRKVAVGSPATGDATAAVITTLHQFVGALLLCLAGAMLVVAWRRRARSASAAPAPAATETRETPKTSRPSSSPAAGASA